MGVEVRSHKGPRKEILDFPVELVDIKKLIPHEETIERELEWFINSIKEKNVLKWPLLIGNRNYTILDGHHRAAGLEELNYTHVPAILIDYYDDELIQLDTWYPKVSQSVDIIIQELEKLNLDIIQVDSDQYSRDRLTDRSITAFVGNNETMYQVTGKRRAIFRTLRDNWISNITYYDDADLCVEQAGTDDTAVISWSYSKDEIIEHVKKKIVHLPKTTRHTLKYRVPEINYPLDKIEQKPS